MWRRRSRRGVEAVWVGVSIIVSGYLVMKSLREEVTSGGWAIGDEGEDLGKELLLESYIL